MNDLADTLVYIIMLFMWVWGFLLAQGWWSLISLIPFIAWINVIVHMIREWGLV